MSLSAIDRLFKGFRAGETLFLLLSLIVAASLLLGGCRASGSKREASGELSQADAMDQRDRTAEPDRATVESVPATPDASGRDIIAIDRHDHWLVVRKAVDAGAGLWGKGEFDAKRNKISVVTKNVAEFTIDTDRIPIDRSRLVIISIDGINAELRPRDYSPLLFRREGHASWSVVEP